MIVQWNSHNVETLPLLAANGVQIGQLTLLPGLNEVRAADWSLIQPQLRDLVKRGVVVVTDNAELVAEPKPAAPARSSASRKKPARRSAARRSD